MYVEGLIKLPNLPSPESSCPIGLLSPLVICHPNRIGVTKAAVRTFFRSLINEKTGLKKT